MKTKTIDKLTILLLIGCIMFWYCTEFNNSTTKKETKVKVENFYDGSITHRAEAEQYFEKHIKSNLKDPKSYEKIRSISRLDSVNNSYSYTVILRYRAKNSFGGYVIESYMGSVTKDNSYVYFKNLIRLE